MNLERMRMMKRRRKKTSSLLMGVKMKWRQKFWTMCELNEHVAAVDRTLCSCSLRVKGSASGSGKAELV